MAKQKNIYLLDEIEKKREKDCIEFLEDRGFIISPPPKKYYDVNTIDELVLFFYLSMYKHNLNRKFRYTPMSEDRKVVSTFVKYRIGVSNVNRKVAMTECARIIEVLFKYEEKLNLKQPITSPIILMQDWLINRALSIINGENADLEQKFFSDIDDLIDKLID